MALDRIAKIAVQMLHGYSIITAVKGRLQEDFLKNF